MNWRGIRAVIAKDLKVVMRSKMIMLPMIILPVILQVLVPAGFGLTAYFAADTMAADTEDDMQAMLEMMPPAVREQIADMQPNQAFLTLMTVYVFAPMYLIVPMMVASVIAADSFVGERERKTLEALLHTPLTNRELLTAKMLSAWLAAIGVAMGSFVLYALVVNGVGWLVMGRLFFPNWMWIVLVLWVAPAVAGIGLGLTVLLSTRVNTFQEAYQMGGVVVLPLIALMIGQLAGVITLSTGSTLAIGAVFWIIDAVIIWLGAKTFDRDALLARL